MNIIKKLNSEENTYLLVNDIFETMNVSGVYTNFGQKVGSANAGDYLSIEKDFSFEHNGETIECKKGEIVSAYENPEKYEAIWQQSKGKNNENVTFEYEKCTGYTFWNGQNFKTITVQVENGEPTHEICEGEEFEKIISEYETAEKVKDVTGGEIWKSENFYYKKSYWQGHFEVAEVESIEDYEMRTGY